MLYLVDQGGHLVKHPDRQTWGIPVRELVIKDKDGLVLFATLRYLNIETLQFWYKGLVQFRRSPGHLGIELWFGHRGVGVLLPEMKLISLRPTHDQ